MRPNIVKGIEAENYVAKQIEKYSNDEIEQNHTWGVDIILKTVNKNIMIEVKSANKHIKNGKKGLRSGKFYFYPNNIDRPDYYAFVIYKSEIVANTVWVKADVIRKHFADRKIRNTKFSLGIPTLLTRIAKIDFSEVIA